MSQRGPQRKFVAGVRDRGGFTGRSRGGQEALEQGTFQSRQVPACRGGDGYALGGQGRVGRQPVPLIPDDQRPLRGKLGTERGVFRGITRDGVQHQHHQSGFGGAFAGTGDPDPFHRVVRLAKTRRVGQSQGNSVKVEGFLDQISRRTGNGGDNRPLGAEQGIQQG